MTRAYNAIDADGHGCPARLQLDQGFARRAVALHQPIRNMHLRIPAQITQKSDEQGCGRYAVDVIIADQSDPLATADGGCQALSAPL